MRNLLKRQLLLLLAIAALMSSASAAVDATPDAATCQTNCLRVYSIKMYDYLASDVQANVQITTDSGGLARGTVVHGMWTLPDGTTLDQYGRIGTRGRAEFRLNSSQTGTFTITVVGATLSGYTFDPAGSNLLSASIDIGDPLPPDPEPPVCLTDCLIVDSLKLRERRGDVRATATVVDENGGSLKGATVTATWTVPDGSSISQTLVTNRKGRARFAVPADASGNYSVTVDEVVLTGFTFVVDGSALSGTYTVN